MNTSKTLFVPSLFRALVTSLGVASLALAGCATEASEDAAEVAQSDEALRIGSGGGGGLGFTCENGTCTCSKQIEGDCDKMRINCTGDMTSFDNCLKGWFTTDCSCTQARTTQPTNPIYVPPISGTFTTFTTR